MGAASSGKKEDLALHVLHSLDQPICIIDADDCFLFANKAYAGLYGLGPETLRGMPLRDLVGEAFYNQRTKALLERARKEGSSEFHGWIEYPETGRRCIESEIRHYTFPGLIDKQCLIIQSRDVTDREELDLRRRKSLEFQESLMGEVPAMVWIAGKDGIPFYYNQSWLNFTGTTLVEQVREGWLGMVNPDDRQMVMDRIKYALHNGEGLHIEFRLRYLMGGYRWVRLMGRPMERTGDGKGDFIASALDIHEIKVREEKMRVSLDEERHLREQAMLQKAAADRANREKSAYLSLASHEIRTPMNPVIGFADLLASNPNLDVDSREMAQMILKAGKNLLTLIDEVLDFAKIEAGVLQLSPEPLNVHDLLMEIDNLYAFDAKSRGIELRIRDNIKTEDELFQDRLRLQQVLGTLVANSIKFTHTGHVDLEAETEKVRINGSHVHMLKFTVRDTGVGMDAEDVEKLFKPFARPDTEFSDKYAGAGLG
ncbi:MAG TPA: PAS domain S-box protein, partial [Oceanipulchritudo sp.]|nr:PAS domain S-box protein [Oceanipulchritudo sp.]